MDCSPPGSSVPGIFQARILEWVATSFSRVSSQPRDRILVSCIAGRLFYLFFTILFLYIWLSWVFVVCGLSVVVGATPQLWCEGYSWWWLPLWLVDSGAHGLQQLRNMGLVALQCVGSSWTRNRTCVPCIDRWMLNHWTTEEALQADS